MNRKTKNKRVTVLGYGSQGSAIALNLRDSGFEVTIGLSSKSKSRRKAKADKFKTVTTTRKAVKDAELIIMAIPDHKQGEVYTKEIGLNLKNGCALVFLHGFAVHFGFIKPPAECDIILLAPHAPGLAVREKYLGERDISAFYAIEQNYSKTALQTVTMLASAIGFEKNRLVKTSFADETLGDLFGEQAILCGGLSNLIMAGYRTLIKKGLSHENAYLEVAYQLDLIISLIKNNGIEGMFDRISTAARVGAIEAGDKIIDRSTEKRMDELFDKIADGSFARKLNRFDDNYSEKIDNKLKKLIHPEFEKTAKKYSK